MSHFDLGFSSPCYTADLKKTTLGLTPLRSNSSIDMQVH
jgi:hypothetical protein